jgi:hypothetical protein
MARVLYAEPADSVKPVLDIALSERNLLILLTKLYTPGSACTIRSGDVPDEFAYAQIRVEPDEYHYQFPTREGAAAGVMHPFSEAVAAAVKVALEQNASLLAGDEAS